MKKLLALFLLCAAFAYGAEDYSTWGSVRLIKVDVASAGIGANITAYPLLVRMTPANFDDFANTKAAGADIRFAKMDGTHLPYQIERWDDVGGNLDTAAIWVKMDSVLTGTVQYLKMYYNNSGAADSSKGTSVFDTSKYFGVWHVNEPGNTDAGNYQDATFRNNDGTGGALTSASSIRGIAGNCLTLNGTTQYVGYGDVLDMGANVSFSMSAWIKHNSSQSTSSRIIGKRPATQTGYEMYLNASDSVGVLLDDGSTVDARRGKQTEDTWTYLMASCNRAGSATWYINGDSIGVASLSTVTSTLGNTGGLNIGRRPVDNDQHFKGEIDEVRILKIVSDKNFIKMNYATQNLSQTVVTVIPTIHVSGTLQASAATSTGTLLLSRIFSGTMQAQSATSSGTFKNIISYSGILQAQSATSSGTFQHGRVVEGTVQAQSATGSGALKVIVSVNGVLQAQSATGEGSINTSGFIHITGSVMAQPATGGGTGIVIITVTGSPRAQAATATGTIKTVSAVVVKKTIKTIFNFMNRFINFHF